MLSITATSARRDFFELMKGVTKQHKVIHIHHRTGSVVLMPEDDYEELLETLRLLSVPGLQESLQRSMQQVRRGKTVAMEKVFKKT